MRGFLLPVLGVCVLLGGCPGEQYGYIPETTKLTKAQRAERGGWANGNGPVNARAVYDTVDRSQLGGPKPDALKD